MTNHDPRTMRQELERVRVWATEQLAEGTERPWSVYQYMKLREASKSILAGMDVAQPMEIQRKRHQIGEILSDYCAQLMSSSTKIAFVCLFSGSNFSHLAREESCI